MVMLPVEVLCMLVESSPLKPVFLFSMKYVSAGESLGDSYALGMAGTGGTSSSSSADVALCVLVCFGAGNRDVDADCGMLRGCIEPVEVLTVLKLSDDPTESPELYDFLLFMSGVVRAEEGVTDAFLGIMDGDLLSARVSIETGGGGGTLIIWFKLCDPGMIDMRFILLVSVGLMVRAPRPVA